MSDEDNDICFQILGPVRLYVGRDEVAITGRERVMMATLLCHANELVAVERLVDAIWGDKPPRDARNQVQGCVSRLRKRLATAGLRERIITEPAGYWIRATAEHLDLQQFREQIADARAAATTARQPEAVAGYRRALSLWRGPALAGIESDLLRRASLALDEEHLRAVEELVDLELATGAGGELVAELTDLVVQYPYRERLHGALMLVLYRAGRQADALAAYQHARRLLVDEVGTEPGLASMPGS